MQLKSLNNLSVASLVLTGALAFGSINLAHADTVDMPPLLVIGTPGTSSSSFASTNVWGPRLQKDLDSNVRVVPEDSEVQRHRRLVERRDMTLSSVSAAELSFMRKGILRFIYWTDCLLLAASCLSLSTKSSTPQFDDCHSRSHFFDPPISRSG